MTSFRDWAHAVFGPEGGDRVADDYADALGRTLDKTVFYGTEKRMADETFHEALETMAQVPPELEGLNEAERLGLVVGAAYGQALAERDKARALAVLLEQQLAEAVKHLRVVKDALDASSGWASDHLRVEKAEQFLDALESPETPETPEGTR